MRKLLLLMAVAAITVALTGSSCSKQPDQAATPEAEAPAVAADAHSADDGHGHAHGTDDGHGHDAPVEMASMTVEGTLGCGHCNYQTTEGCSVALQTADGSIYLVEGGDQAALMDVRMDQPAASVSGTVTTRDGLKIIQVESYNLN